MYERKELSNKKKKQFTIVCCLQNFEFFVDKLSHLKTSLYNNLKYDF